MVTQIFVIFFNQDFSKNCQNLIFFILQMKFKKNLYLSIIFKARLGRVGGWRQGLEQKHNKEDHKMNRMQKSADNQNL